MLWAASKQQGAAGPGSMGALKVSEIAGWAHTSAGVTLA